MYDLYIGDGMNKYCKRCHRRLNVANVVYCDICQSDIDKHDKNNW